MCISEVKLKVPLYRTQQLPRRVFIRASSRPSSRPVVPSLAHVEVKIADQCGLARMRTGPEPSYVLPF
jgi:hypothetical protein